MSIGLDASNWPRKLGTDTAASIDRWQGGIGRPRWTQWSSSQKNDSKPDSLNPSLDHWL